MTVLYENFHRGTITNNPLAVGGLSISSADFAELPVVASPNTISLTLDPDAVDGDPEIVEVTAHSAAATTVTVVRARQTSLNGGVAHEHTLGTVWRWTWTAADAIATVDVIGDTMTGDLNFTTAGKIGFGSRLGQHIDLYSNTFGVGIESGTLYLRSGDQFQFYVGGAGTGGTSIMGVDPTGVYLPVDPTHTWHAARKYYVDAGDDARVAITGDAMTGALQIAGSPWAAQTGAIVGPEGYFVSHVVNASLPNIRLTRSGTAGDVSNSFAQFYRTSVINTSGVIVGSIQAASGGSSCVYNTTSDRRLKDDLGPITDGLTQVNALQPRHLAWKTDGTQFDGFIADEVQPVVPYAVTGEPDAVLPPDDPIDPGAIDPQQLDTGKLIPILVAAVQELSARVAELEAR